MIDPIVFPLAHVLDTDGRPLLEQACAPSLRDACPVELGPCTYADSRGGTTKPMNLSALDQIRACWPEVMANFEFLRAHVQAQPGATLSLRELWRVGELATACVPYLLYRRRDPVVPDALPGSVAAGYKIALGLNAAVLRRLHASTMSPSDARVEAAVDAEELLAFIAQSGMLIGHRQVCAGPPKMIREVVRALVEGRPQAQGDAVLARLVPAPEQLLRYAASMMNASWLTILFTMLTESAHQGVREALATSAFATPRRAHLALFARIGPAAGQALLVRICAALTIEGGDDDARLHRSIGRLPTILRPVAAAQRQAIRTLLGAGGRTLDDAGVDAIVRYLRLEQVAGSIATKLRGQTLAALELGGPAQAIVSPSFYPPDPNMRHLLAAAFGVELRPGPLAQRGDHKLELSALINLDPDLPSERDPCLQSVRHSP